MPPSSGLGLYSEDPKAVRNLGTVRIEKALRHLDEPRPQVERAAARLTGDAFSGRPPRP